MSVPKHLLLGGWYRRGIIVHKQRYRSSDSNKNKLHGHRVELVKFILVNEWGIKFQSIRWTKEKDKKAKTNRHKTTQKAKDWTTLITLKTLCELRCSDVASSFCSCYKSGDKSWTRKTGRDWLLIFCHIKHKLPWPTFYVEQFFNLIQSYQWNTV